MAAALVAPSAAANPEPPELLYSTEGNRLRRFDVDTLDHPSPLEDVLVPSANDGEQGGGSAAGRARDVNGMICLLPDGTGRFVLGEDTGQPHPRPGWGVFTRGGVQVGKLTPTAFVEQAEPFGCVFDSHGNLFTTEVGNQGFGTAQGQLIQWFPPYDVFPGPPGEYPETDAVSTNFCKIAVVSTATGIAIDEQDRIYVASPSASVVYRFSGAFPTGPDAARGCGRSDALGSPLVDEGRVAQEVFISDPRAAIPSGIARVPNGNWYVSGVLLGTITEVDPAGTFVRTILAPTEPIEVLPKSTGSPQSLAVDAEGSIYYADLDLQGDFFGPEPGDDGKVRRVRFDENGEPLPPTIVRSGLAFPDGVALLPGDLSLWPTYGGSPERKFFNPAEKILGPGNVGDLRTRWRFPTGSIITGSPTVALAEVAGEGRIPIVYLLSWDLNLYAVRLSDGSELWRFATEDQPGASFPATASVDVSEIDGSPRVFVGQGETFYSLDAATGEELWHFTAGTGCLDGRGRPPGLCGFDGERNEIESSALVHEGLVYFGMDVNDVETGKGGFYALDARDGRMLWFFDLETGSTCRPFPSDEIRRFDGYHTREQLGLPRGFFESRPGCDFERTRTGCGNVWSSPALDAERGLLYVASSNCDTDLDRRTSIPPPPMPPYDEAVFALGLDGTPVWRWRPREVDNDDLAFGAPPNLFTIQTLRGERDVLGIGNKDGTYYVLDRDGVNALNGAPAGDPNPLAFPYWIRNVVPGGDIGGILAAAAVDEQARRIYFSTAPGRDGVNDPPGPAQTPTVHALDMDTGAVVWDNGAEATPQPSFGPTSAIPGLAFFGHVPFAFLRAYETANDSGTRLADFFLDIFGLASAPAVVQGTVLVGNGIGVRTDTGSGPPVVSLVPSPLTAFCVPGTLDCWPCRDGFDNDDGEDGTDFPEDAECTSETDLSEENDCADGLDNDGDGLRDFPDDPDCASAGGVTEVPEPGALLLAAAALGALPLVARRSRRRVQVVLEAHRPRW